MSQGGATPKTALVGWVFLITTVQMGSRSGGVVVSRWLTCWRVSG